MKKKGFDKCSLYQCRKIVPTLMSQKGYDLSMIKAATGHTSVAIDAYVREEENRQRLSANLSQWAEYLNSENGLVQTQVPNTSPPKHQPPPRPPLPPPQSVAETRHESSDLSRVFLLFRLRQIRCPSVNENTRRIRKKRPTFAKLKLDIQPVAQQSAQQMQQHVPSSNTHSPFISMQDCSFGCSSADQFAQQHISPKFTQQQISPLYQVDDAMQMQPQPQNHLIFQYPTRMHFEPHVQPQNQVSFQYPSMLDFESHKHRAGSSWLRRTDDGLVQMVRCPKCFVSFSGFDEVTEHIWLQHGRGNRDPGSVSGVFLEKHFELNVVHFFSGMDDDIEAYIIQYRMLMNNMEDVGRIIDYKRGVRAKPIDAYFNSQKQSYGASRAQIRNVENSRYASY